MVKAKFRDNVRSKTPVAMKNEVLCKFLAHNICCLIMSQLELGIEVKFWGEKAGAAVAAESPAPVPAPPAPIVEAVPQAVKVAVERSRWAFAGA